MPDKYERENDSAEDTLSAVHETVGRIKALADELSTYVDKLNKEMKDRKGES